MNFRIHTILYFAAGIAFIALETIGVAWISIAVKSLIIPLLIWLYLRFVRGHWNRFHSMIIIALIFSWIGDITLQLTQFQESFFLVGLGSFLITQLIYMVAFFITPGKNTLFFRKIYLLIPVALYGWGILWLLSAGLGDMKLPVTVYTVVILSMLLAAVNREKKVNRQSFLLVLAGAILFVLSDSMIAINKFSQPFELARIAILSSYFTAQYLIALGCARQFNLTLK
ncbi:MAG: lysoplasmalogenase [Bacteroidales bacterium]|nr:lysoplasmalogenase [Bacteroidales bacterium]